MLRLDFILYDFVEDIKLIRSYLWRYQSHELRQLRQRGLFWLLIVLAPMILANIIQDYRNDLEHKALLLDQVTARLAQEQRDYFNCLTNRPIGKDKNGNVLFCNVSPMEIKIIGEWK